MGWGMLASGAAGWFLAGLLKVPILYLINKKIDWGIVLGTGGMPSSHAAFVTATAMGVGLFAGFTSPEFAIAFALMVVVTYDAAGVRRQAGIHAERINMILNELMSGHQLTEKQLKEVLGHTPFEVLGGVLTGLVAALIVWLVWPK
jgi:acid phosphatase family membrane protein YuiD